VEIWDTQTWEQVNLENSHIPSSVMFFSGLWSADGCLLALGGSDGVISVYRLPDLHVLQTFNEQSEPIYDLAWSLDNARLFAVGGDGIISQ
jgi:WD40 repeat protein